MASVSQAVQDKAHRYLMEGRIEPELVGGPIESFIAHGDADYRVVVGPAWELCECPATVMCCHRIGGRTLYNLRRSSHVSYLEIVERVVDRKSAHVRDGLVDLARSIQ